MIYLCQLSKAGYDEASYILIHLKEMLDLKKKLFFAKYIVHRYNNIIFYLIFRMLKKELILIETKPVNSESERVSE